MQGGLPFLRQRDFALAQRVAATGAKIFIEVLVGQDQQQTFPHRHRLGALAAIESGGLEGFKLFHVNPRMKPDPTRGAQANNIVAPSPEAISRAVELLREGQVVGIADGNGLRPRRRRAQPRPRWRASSRSSSARFSIRSSCISPMPRARSRWPEQIPTAARELAQQFWPGPLTLVLRKKEIVPDLATSGLPNVALRVPAHPVAQALLARVWRSARRAEREPLRPHQPHRRASRARRTGRSRAADSRRRTLRGRPGIDRAFSFRTSARVAARGRNFAARKSRR